MNRKPKMILKNVRKSYGDLEVLKGIDLEIYEGEVVAILGASGSGKSTLLRTINYLESVDEGQMIFDDQRLSMDVIGEKDKQEIRKKISMVFQHYNLFQNKRVLENVMEGLIVSKKLKKAEAEKRAKSYLNKVNILDKDMSFPHQLSGGQQQRVGIARALAMEPDLILFDEATSALDPELVGEVLKVIKTLAQEDRTMVVVTHELDFAREVADRIIFLDEGRVLLNESPDKFFEQQENERVLRFIKSLRDVS